MTTPHPKLIATQQAWNALAAGDVVPSFSQTATDVLMWHGPGAGPYAGAGQGTERFLGMAAYFDRVFAGSFHQQGRCVHADDDVAVTVVHETGTATDGAVFDNRALWISRFRPDGLVDAVWTVDLDHERMVAFWAARPVEAAR